MLASKSFVQITQKHGYMSTNTRHTSCTDKDVHTNTLNTNAWKLLDMLLLTIMRCWTIVEHVYVFVQLNNL